MWGGRFIRWDRDFLIAPCTHAPASVKAWGPQAMTATSGPGFAQPREALGLCAIMGEIHTNVVTSWVSAAGKSHRPAEGGTRRRRIRPDWGCTATMQIIVLTTTSLQDVFCRALWWKASTWRNPTAPVILLFEQGGRPTSHEHLVSRNQRTANGGASSTPPQ